MDESEITKLLKIKHDKDVFVPGCKNGPTQTGDCLRILDAWVFKRSWSPITMIGYEIKVSRSDFLQDEKWYDYLKYCHQFYFVCPYGLIKSEELSPEVGLIYTSKTGSRLYTKRKAPRREIDLADCSKLFLYLLMCRSKIDGFGSDELSNVEYWRDWLAQKKENREVGCRVSFGISQMIQKAKDNVKIANHRIAKWKSFKEKLRKVGIDPDDQEWTFDRKIADLRMCIDPDLIRGIKAMSRRLDKTASILEGLV